MDKKLKVDEYVIAVPEGTPSQVCKAITEAVIEIAEKEGWGINQATQMIAEIMEEIFSPEAFLAEVYTTAEKCVEDVSRAAIEAADSDEVIAGHALLSIAITALMHQLPLHLMDEKMSSAWRNSVFSVINRIMDVNMKRYSEDRILN